MRWRWVVVAGVLLGSLASAQAPAPRPQAKPEVATLLTKAAEMDRPGNAVAAIAAYLVAAEKAKELGDDYGYGQAHQRAGAAAYGRGDLESAMKHFVEARDAFAKAGSKIDEMSLRGNIAVILDNTGRWTEARPIYLELLEYATQAKLPRMIASSQLNMAILELKTTRNAEALDWARKAYASYVELKDDRWAAGSMLRIGEALCRLEQFDEGMRAYRATLDLDRKAKNLVGEAGTLLAMAALYRNLGEPLKSIPLLQRSLEIRQSLGDQRFASAILSEMGICYSMLGQPAVALNAMERAVEFARRTRNPVLMDESLGRYAALLHEAKRYREAEAVLRELIPITRSISNKYGEGLHHATLGRVLGAQGKLEEAKEALDRAAVLISGLGNNAMDAYVATARANVLTRQGNTTLALAEYAKALESQKTFGDAHAIASAYGLYGQALLRVGKTTEAEKNLRESVRLSEQYRLRLGASTTGRAEYLSQRVSVYRDLASLLQRTGREREAFMTIQATKGRSLVDSLGGAQAALESRMTPAEREREQRLRLRADSLNAAMVREGAQNEVGAKARFAKLKQDLQEAESELSGFLTDLYARHPDIAANQGRSVSLGDIARRLDDETAILEYALGTRPMVFVVTKERGRLRIAAKTLAVNEAVLVTEARTLSKLASNPRSDPRALLASLTRSLLAPIAGEIKGKRRLVICPDGPLWDVPFGALGSTEPLLARFDLRYAYSAASLVNQGSRLSSPKVSLFVVANPDFGGAARFGDNPLIPGQRPIETPSRPIDTPSRPIDTPSRPIDTPSRPIDTPSRPIDTPSRPIDTPSRPIEPPSRDLGVAVRGGIVQLPGTQAEANALARLFPGTRVLSGLGAQEASVIAEAGRFSVVHLASHAFFNDAAPMLSSIVLATPPAGGPDGYLTAREILNLKLAADMVVLSACNTARGDRRTGDGLVGLSYALSVAGAQSQVVSQWSVDDRATAVLMTRFYGNLKRGWPKDKALREAALSLRDPRRKDNDPRWRHPYYWAPFILLGDSRPLRP